jgi:hypothetical protein
MSERRGRVAAVAALVLAGCFASSAAAQTASGNQGRIKFVAGMDFTNAYMFRGLLQDDTRVIMWPFAEAAAELHSGGDAVDSVTLHIGTWNSLHTGLTGLQRFPFPELWYESDLYGTLAVGFGDGIVASGTYTVYTSPSNAFSTIQEISFKAAYDDTGTNGIGLSPYALVAFELGTSPGLGQADAGLSGGTYLEVGVSPGWADAPVNLRFPIKIGLSLDDYYEVAGVDNKFGFLSLAAVATVPFANSRSYGAWNVHGGIEFQSLGNAPEVFNRGEQTKLIASVGVSFSY